MSEKEKSIINRLSMALPKLNREDQKYVLGIAEGMVLVKEKPDGAGNIADQTRQLQEA